MTTEGQAIRKMEGSETLMRRYEIVWSPEGRVIRTVWAASPKEAKRMTPRPYRQYMGEVYRTGGPVMKTIFTGWRTVTPGKCFECGSDDAWTCDGRGNVLCDCQACPDCGLVDAYGFHEPGCPVLEEAQS